MHDKQSCNRRNTAYKRKRATAIAMTLSLHFAIFFAVIVFMLCVKSCVGALSPLVVKAFLHCGYGVLRARFGCKYLASGKYSFGIEVDKPC